MEKLWTFFKHYKGVNKVRRSAENVYMGFVLLAALRRLQMMDGWATPTEKQSGATKSNLFQKINKTSCIYFLGDGSVYAWSSRPQRYRIAAGQTKDFANYFLPLFLWCSQTVCTRHYALNTIIAFYSVNEWSNFAVSVRSMACQATTLSHYTETRTSQELAPYSAVVL